MKRYKISILGRDDETIFEMELTDDEAKVIERVCQESKETSTYVRIPTMKIEEGKEG